MTTDWTDSSTWTFELGEHVEIADGVIAYCDNCCAKYPYAKNGLANLRIRAAELRGVEHLSRNSLQPLHETIMNERTSEGTGFNMLAEYVHKLYARL